MAIRQQVAVIGSTGSIGTTTLRIISKYPKIFKVLFIACNKNYKILNKQIKFFLPRYVYVKDKEVFLKLKNKKFKRKIIFINNFKLIKKLLIKIKIDKSVLCVPSYEGLNYAFDLVDISKEILIANKESIVCGGNVFLKYSKKKNCKITSIDSEHYCLSELIKDYKIKSIKTFYLTASGGPFLNKKKNDFKKSNINEVTKHPRWNMGKKISVDSATMVNKILEIIEAHVLFSIPIDKIKIKIHKESLVHAAIVLNNGLVKFAMHDTSMSIPIRNCLLNNKLFNQKKIFFSDTSNFNLSFNHVQLKQYDVLNTGFKILKLGQRAWILFNVINDKLVDKFLKGEIFFYQITQNLIKIFNKKSTIHYCKKKIIKFSDIMETINFGTRLVK